MMRRRYVPWRDTVWAVAELLLLTWLVLPAIGVGS